MHVFLTRHLWLPLLVLACGCHGNLCGEGTLTDNTDYAECDMQDMPNWTCTGCRFASSVIFKASGSSFTCNRCEFEAVIFQEAAVDFTCPECIFRETHFATPVAITCPWCMFSGVSVVPTFNCNCPGATFGDNTFSSPLAGDYSGAWFYNPGTQVGTSPTEAAAGCTGTTCSRVPDNDEHRASGPDCAVAPFSDCGAECFTCTNLDRCTFSGTSCKTNAPTPAPTAPPTLTPTPPTTAAPSLAPTSTPTSSPTQGCVRSVPLVNNSFSGCWEGSLTLDIPLDPNEEVEWNWLFAGDAVYPSILTIQVSEATTTSSLLLSITERTSTEPLPVSTLQLADQGAAYHSGWSLSHSIGLSLLGTTAGRVTLSFQLQVRQLFPYFLPLLPPRVDMHSGRTLQLDGMSLLSTGTLLLRSPEAQTNLSLEFNSSLQRPLNPSDLTWANSTHVSASVPGDVSDTRISFALPTSNQSGYHWLDFVNPALPAHLPVLDVARVEQVRVGTRVSASGRTARTSVYYLATSCPEGQLLVGESCSACYEGGFCPGDDRVFPIPGFWSVNDRTKPTACVLAEACRGAFPPVINEDGSVSTEVCNHPYTGPYCSDCKPQFHKQDAKCRSCGIDTVEYVMLYVMASIFMVALFCAAVFLNEGMLNNVATFGICVQQSSVIARVIVPYLDAPGAIGFFHFLSLANFEVEFFKPGCTSPKLTFVEYFWTVILFMFVTAMMATLASLIHVVLAGGGKLCTCGQVASLVVKHGTSWSLGKKIKYRLTYVLNVLATMFHLQLCTRTMQGLQCITTPRGFVLKTDLVTECYKGAHLGTAIVMWLILLCFCVGYPLWASYIMRRTITKGELKNEKRVAKYGYLYRGLRVKYAWFRLLSFLVNLTLAITATLFARDVAARILASFFVITIITLPIIALRPFTTLWRNVMMGSAGFAAAGQIVIFLFVLGKPWLAVATIVGIGLQVGIAVVIHCLLAQRSKQLDEDLAHTTAGQIELVSIQDPSSQHATGN